MRIKRHIQKNWLAPATYLAGKMVYGSNTLPIATSRSGAPGDW